jgi:hypothetical protein
MTRLIERVNLLEKIVFFSSQFYHIDSIADETSELRKVGELTGENSVVFIRLIFGVQKFQSFT